MGYGGDGGDGGLGGVNGDVGSRRRGFTAMGVRAWRPLVVEPIAGGRPSLVCRSVDTASEDLWDMVAMAATGGTVGLTATRVRGDVGSRRRGFTAMGVRAWRPLVVEPIAGRRRSLVCRSTESEAIASQQRTLQELIRQSKVKVSQTQGELHEQQSLFEKQTRANLVSDAASTLECMKILEGIENDLEAQRTLFVRQEIILTSAKEIRRGKEALGRGEELIEELKFQARSGRSLDDIEAKMAEQEKSFFGACYNFYTVDEKVLAQVLFQKKQAEQEQNALNIIKKFAGKMVEATVTPIPKETILGKLLSVFPFFRAN